ncbi:MAG: hypothetical protein ABI678_30165 [Kofleriaceae bacterium]
MRSVVLASCLFASTAVAGGRDRVAVISLDVSASAPTYLAPKLTQQIEQGLAAAGYDVVPNATVTASLAGAFATCRDGTCLGDAGRVLNVQVLVVASITLRGESTVISMRLHDARTGERLAELGDVCDLCGEAELIERVGIEASALRARADHSRASTAPIVLQPAERGSVVPGLAVGFAGVAVLAGGIVLLGIDGHGTCSAGDTPVYPDPGAVIRYPDPSNPNSFVCHDLYATKALGITTIGVGVAAVALGAVLVVRAHEHEVQVTPTPGGATVGMTFTW